MTAGQKITGKLAAAQCLEQGLSVDHARSVVYAPAGSATPDFNGSTRKGDNLFANTILA